MNQERREGANHEKDKQNDYDEIGNGNGEVDLAAVPVDVDVADSAGVVGVNWS